MRILVINCGSSSLKYDLFDMAAETNLAAGGIDRLGSADAVHKYSVRGVEKKDEKLNVPDHAAGLKLALSVVVDPKSGALSRLSEIDAVGHRAVHGGTKFTTAVEISDDVLEHIKSCTPLAPLHNPANIAGIEECRRLMPGVPQVAVFDTTFHHTIPKKAYLYGLPFEYFKDFGIRRFGFHGTSHHFVALKAATHLRKPFAELKLISCHLGNGASVCAIDYGKSVDTTMGMTPLEGLVMGTRCGDVDPGVLLLLMRDRGIGLKDLDQALNKNSGLKGISGISNDMREILAAADDDNERALLAVRVFCYRVKKYIGAYMAALEGLDAVIFTGGIGENASAIRARSCQGLSVFGIELDELKNGVPAFTQDGVAEVSAPGSRSKVLVVRTDEELMIARESARILSHRTVTRIILKSAHKPIPVGVSVQHVHLTQEHKDALFGKETELTKKNDLRQPGHWVSKETVSLIGPGGRVDRVGIICPFRKESQVEISRTLEFRLGIDAPIRASGDLADTPGIVLEGPRGSAKLDRGVICAQRHIHMSPADTEAYGLKDKDIVRLRAEGPRPMIFGDVLVRVDPNFVLELHLDTDEANAAELTNGSICHLEGIQGQK
ncbi:MAG: acetate/propionate family kinase [Planctomycetota bacterium]|nr:acetate/propionate family kinase [Planctomycetota bacterium]